MYVFVVKVFINIRWADGKGGSRAAYSLLITLVVVGVIMVLFAGAANWSSTSSGPEQVRRILEVPPSTAVNATFLAGIDEDFEGNPYQQPGQPRHPHVPGVFPVGVSLPGFCLRQQIRLLPPPNPHYALGQRIVRFQAPGFAPEVLPGTPPPGWHNPCDKRITVMELAASEARTFDLI